MTTTTDIKIDGARMQPFVQALLGASGITKEQAKIYLLYVLCTFRTGLRIMPILAFIGMTGTGKSAVLDQMLFLVNAPTIATGTTYATVRNEMHNCGTYIIDEADRVSEKLILLRTDGFLSKLTYNRGTGHGWKSVTINILFCLLKGL